MGGSSGGGGGGGGGGDNKPAKKKKAVAKTPVRARNNKQKAKKAVVKKAVAPVRGSPHERNRDRPATPIKSTAKTTPIKVSKVKAVARPAPVKAKPVKAVAPSPNEQGQKPIAKPAPVKAVAKPAPVKARANNNQRANLPSEVAKRSLQPVSKKPVKAKVTTPSPKLTVPKPTPAKKMNFLEKMFTPTKESIAKNKIAGAKFTASQKAKGIGVARSNITDGGGNRIKGVANSQSNPALQKLAKEGKRGAEGLNTLAARQSAQTGKDTSFSGIAKSLMSGEKHAPRQSLLQFGSGDPRGENNVHKDYSTSPKLNAVPSGFGGKVGGGKVSTAAPKKKIAVTVGQSSGGSGGSNQDTALAGGAAATATNQPDNLKNMLAIKKNAQRQGKRKLRQKRNTSVGFGNGGVGLNITT